MGRTERFGPGDPATATAPGSEGAALPAEVVVLTPAVRWTVAALRIFAYGSLLWLAATVLAGEGALASNTLAQVRAFVALVLAPEAAARGLLWASRAALSLQGGLLVLARGPRRIELAAREVGAVRAWRLPAPGPGVSLRLASGATWAYGLAQVDAVTLQVALAGTAASAVTAPHSTIAVPAAGAAPSTHGEAPPAAPADAAARFDPTALAARHGQALLAPRGSRFLQHALTKFVGLPFLLAIPAFRLHQHIAFGGGLGELQMFGLVAYAKGFALWWAAWGIGVVMVAAALRALIEAVTLVAVLWRPGLVLEVRRVLEHTGLAALYLGIPAWFALRFVGG